MTFLVIPAQAGIPGDRLPQRRAGGARVRTLPKARDSRLRGNDGVIA
jgi:hypothetical protein